MPKDKPPEWFKSCATFAINYASRFTLLYVEHEVKMKLDANTSLVGHIDCVMRNDTYTAIIMDWKTCKSAYSNNKHMCQVYLYAIIYSIQHNIPLSSMMCAVVYVNSKVHRVVEYAASDAYDCKLLREMLPCEFYESWISGRDVVA